MRAEVFHVGAALMMALSFLNPAAGVEPPRQQRLEQPRTVFSETRRFIVTGFPLARGTEIARWAEGVAQRVANQFGPIPFERGETVLIEGATRAGLDALLHAGQGCREGVVWQKLTMRNLEQLEAEQADEVLAGLLISRYVQAAQDPTARCVSPGRAPDWLVVGLIHHTSPELKARDREAAIQRWTVGQLESLSGLLDRYFIPPGRWPEKADSTLLVSWLLDSARGTALLGEALRLQGQGQMPDAAWWANQVIGAPDIARAQREWDLWIAELQNRTQTLSAGDARMLARVHLLPLPALESAGGPPELAGEPLSVLIRHRDEPWVRSLAVRLALRYRLETIGLEAEAVDLATRYAQFLDAVAQRGSTRSLKKKWAEAEERRVAFEVMVEGRQRYLDVLEERMRPDDAGASAVRRYLDSVESRAARP